MTTDRIGADPARRCSKGTGRRRRAAAAGFPGFVQAQTSEPIRLGFQVHRTGIGAAYGRWYERTTRPPSR